MVAAEGAALAGRQPPLAVDAFGQFEGLPAVGGQPGGERVLLEFARRGEEGADRLGVVVPAGAGAGRPADQPGLAAAGPFEPHPGAALGVERERGDQLGVGGGTAYEVEQLGLAWAPGAVAGRGGRREGETDTGTVLRGSRGARGSTESGARGEKRCEFSRTGDTRSPHSGRGPYGPSATGAHGVGHDPEYTMAVRSGQLTSLCGPVRRLGRPRRAVPWPSPPASPRRPASPRPPRTARPDAPRSAR